MWVYVKFTFEGLHKWKDAPENTSFLRNLHRHIFHVVVKVQVFENDREIEFYELLKYCKSIFTLDELASCESMAQMLGYKITQRYPDRRVIVDISEDNENGAIYESL